MDIKNTIPSAKILEHLKETQPQFTVKGMTKNGNIKYEFPLNWVDIPDNVMGDEFKGKKVSIAVTLILK
jgi:hypothetical protein